MIDRLRHSIPLIAAILPPLRPRRATFLRGPGKRVILAPNPRLSIPWPPQFARWSDREFFAAAPARRHRWRGRAFEPAIRVCSRNADTAGTRPYDRGRKLLGGPARRRRARFNDGGGILSQRSQERPA